MQNFYTKLSAASAGHPTYLKFLSHLTQASRGDMVSFFPFDTPMAMGWGPWGRF